MRKILMRRVPKKTNHRFQYKVMKDWSDVIVEVYSPRKGIGIVSVKELKKVESNNKVK